MLAVKYVKCIISAKIYSCRLIPLQRALASVILLGLTCSTKPLSTLLTSFSQTRWSKLDIKGTVRQVTSKLL